MRVTIRATFTSLIALVVTVAASSSDTASAQSRWCAYYDRLGATNCGFATFAQCQATVFGIGGHCARSPYSYYDDRPRRRYR
jgi:hypothetical protein